MQSLFSIIQTMLLCGTLLAVTFVVLLSLPKSRLREFLMPIIGWCVAIFCGVYCISPIDVVPEAVLGPFGLIDDLGALVTGIAAARMAMKPTREESH
ncbi:MAG: DUF1232 domain-containing protein [Planctomycetales bacterium]|nr:DUF1232 domain-containing protein [Planctomycetales bacterium]